MRNSGSSGLWPFLALVAVGSTVISMMGSSEVQGVPRACCFDNADCSFLSRSTCVAQQGAPQEVGTNCSTVECPLLCGGSYPECNGACPNPGQTCREVAQNGNAGGGAEAVSVCQCVYGACCFGATGGPYPFCGQSLNQSACEGQGGVYMGDGTNCSACESLCGFSAPQCGGECPPGSRCAVAGAMAQSGQAAGAGASGSPCQCEPITGACCRDNPATGQCASDVNASRCAEIGGIYQGDDTNCSTVECPRDCGYATAPECNGGCPEGQTCFETGNFGAQGGGAGGGPSGDCQCFTPPGGECIPEQDTCQPGFVCDPASEVCCNRICDGEGESCDTTGICRVTAPAPAVSPTGLLVFLALLIVTGGLGVLRLRVRRQ